ncbi:MAG TPA: hypothetical protein VMB34_32920 [Acetobacteraceae bacterium]|nr:hypothetical protein [Acetobacteraceae bacterium]
MRTLLKSAINAGLVVLLTSGLVYFFSQNAATTAATNAAISTGTWVWLEDLIGISGVDGEEDLIFVLYVVIALSLSVALVALLNWCVRGRSGRPRPHNGPRGRSAA